MEIHQMPVSYIQNSQTYTTKDILSLLGEITSMLVVEIVSLRKKRVYNQ